MAWYPVYRIPDAPLTAKFLTYHSLAPMACSATHYGALCPLPARPAPSWQASGLLCLPAIGLKCISLGCGSWLDAVPGLHGELPMSPCYMYQSSNSGGLCKVLIASVFSGQPALNMPEMPRGPA